MTDAPDLEVDCIFCRIVAGTIPGEVLLRTPAATVFRDVNPQLPTHLLAVPNRHLASTEALTEADDALVGAVVRAARDAARTVGLAAPGYRLVVNTGADAGNTVPHLHVHVLGGRPMAWPPG